MFCFGFLFPFQNTGAASNIHTIKYPELALAIEFAQPQSRQTDSKLIHPQSLCKTVTAVSGSPRHALQSPLHQPPAPHAGLLRFPLLSWELWRETVDCVQWRGQNQRPRVITVPLARKRKSLRHVVLCGRLQRGYSCADGAFHYPQKLEFRVNGMMSQPAVVGQSKMLLYRRCSASVYERHVT